MSLSDDVKVWFGFYNKDRVAEAERIICAFKTMLSIAHLSENKSSACEWARQEIAEYEKKWK